MPVMYVVVPTSIPPSATVQQPHPQPQWESPSAVCEISERPANRVRCYYCGGVGHKAIHCEKNPEWCGETSGLCVVHNRMRSMSNLRPVPGSPGQLQCIETSQCRCMYQRALPHTHPAHHAPAEAHALFSIPSDGTLAKFVSQAPTTASMELVGRSIMGTECASDLTASGSQNDASDVCTLSQSASAPQTSASSPCTLGAPLI